VKQIQVELDAEGRERLLQAALGLTLGEAENVFAKMIVKHQRLSADHVDEVFAEKQQIIRKSGLLEYYATDEDFTSVGGLAVLEGVAEQARRRLHAEAHAYGSRPERHPAAGVQGCGRASAPKPSPGSGNSAAAL